MEPDLTLIDHLKQLSVAERLALNDAALQSILTLRRAFAQTQLHHEVSAQPERE